MAQLLYLVVALSVGFGSAVQVAMISSVGRSRGPMEAAWLSLLGTVVGLSLVLGLRSLRGNPPQIPPPFDGAIAFTLVLVAAVAALAASMRGLPAYLAIAGLFGMAYIVSAGVVAPKIGVALFASAVTVGTLLGSVALDHAGAFGIDVHRLNAYRVLGVAALVAGLALVRTR